MSQTLISLIIIGTFGFITFVKPEWLFGWLLNLIIKKFEKKQQNEITNQIGIKLLESGIYFIEKIEDVEILNEMETIKETVQEIKQKIVKLPFQKRS